MGKYKYLLKNIGLVTINNFTSKILAFLLVPLYTNVLSTAEYGTYDLYTTTAFLLIPILSVDIAETLVRFLLDENVDEKEVFTISIRYYIRACLICLVLVIANKIFNIVPMFNQYVWYFFGYFVLCMLSDIMNQFTRGKEQLVDMAIAGILNSIMTIVLNILFLLYLHWGLEGYFLASNISFATSSIFLMIRTKAWKYIKYSPINKNTSREMRQYSMPLILNNIAWWINNVSDRYIVIWLCGVAANGIYSVAYKIPSILTMFQTIFNQAWTLSAVKEYDENNSEFYENIYKIYNSGMVIICSGLIIFNKVIARILFANEFYKAWEYAPFLMISVVFGSLGAVIGGIFTATKKSAIIGKTTFVGAVTNIVLNFILVYKIGPLGAAIATMISYVVVWAIRVRAVNNIISFRINHKRNNISYGILLVQAIAMVMITNIMPLILVEIVCCLIVCSLYFSEVKGIVKSVVNKKLKKGI